MRLEMLCFTILLSVSTGLSSVVKRAAFGKKWKLFSNKRATNLTLSVIEHVDSVSLCIVLCLEMQSCVSVFYRQVYKMCQFHDVLFLSPQDWEDDIGTEYYSLTEAGSCPLGYIHARHVDLCYQVHLNWIHYDESHADCASRGEHFIVVDSQEKQDHLRKQFLSSSDAQLRSYYIDGSDAEIEGQWVYHDGRPITFFDWLEGYPSNNTDHLDYIVAIRLETDPFSWRDLHKTKKFYICQKDI